MKFSKDLHRAQKSTGDYSIQNNLTKIS